jgi:hypothetical protein
MWRPLSQRSALTPSLVHDLPEVLGRKSPAAHPPTIHCMHSKRSLRLGSSTLQVIPKARTNRSPPLLSYGTPFSSGLVLTVLRRGGGQTRGPCMCVRCADQGSKDRPPVAVSVVPQLLRLFTAAPLLSNRSRDMCIQYIAIRTSWQKVHGGPWSGIRIVCCMRTIGSNASRAISTPLHALGMFTVGNFRHFRSTTLMACSIPG